MLVMVGKLDYDCIAWPFRRLAGRPATRMLRNFLAQLHEAEDFCRTSVGLLDDIELLVKSYIRALLRWGGFVELPMPIPQLRWKNKTVAARNIAVQCQTPAPAVWSTSPPVH